MDTCSIIKKENGLEAKLPNFKDFIHLLGIHPIASQCLDPRKKIKALDREATWCSRITVSHKGWQHWMCQTSRMNMKIGARTSLVSTTAINIHRTMQDYENSFENYIILFLFFKTVWAPIIAATISIIRILNTVYTVFINWHKILKKTQNIQWLCQYIGILSFVVTKSQKCHMKEV